MHVLKSLRARLMHGKKSVTRPPFISHYAIIQGEMVLFLTFSVFELQRGYLYQNGVEFRQKELVLVKTCFGVIFTTTQGVYGPFPCNHYFPGGGWGRINQN